MTILKNKIAIIFDKGMEQGVTANRTAVLMSGLAAKFPGIIGEDHKTNDGITVNGFTQLPVSILNKPDSATYHELLEKIESLECTSFIFLKRAQGLRSYEEYSNSINSDLFTDLDIDTLLIYGSTKSVNKVTGNFQAMR